MKRTSKFLVLLASLGLLLGCSSKKSSNNNSNNNNNNNPSNNGDDTPAEVVENLINVIYFNSYVSDDRANVIKTGLVTALTTAGETVDASKINFFKSRNTKVAGLGEEILDYNEENPQNTIDVLLGANNFNAWDDAELKPLFEAKYENDGKDYTYGTHSTMSNNSNRKFFYDKAKANDKYVKALQTYLQENWMDDGEEPPVEQTNQLVVAVYGSYVSEERMNEMFDGFKAYLTTQNKTIENLIFVLDSTSTTIAEFVEFVKGYNTDNPTEKVDALLGLKTNAALTEAGYAMVDKTDYNYGTKEGSEADRRLWIDPSSANKANIDLLEAYLKAKWVPAPVVENHYYLTGTFNEWATTNLTQELLKVEENHYRISNVELAANAKFKVYSPEEEKYYSNDSTWTDCGFTLDENKNIVVEEGTYTIDLHLNGENNNFVTLEKQAAPKSLFVLGIYDKYVSSERAAEIKTAVQTKFDTEALNTDVVLANLGTGNMAFLVTAINTYNTDHSDNKIAAVLGSKADNADLTTAGYEYLEGAYTYGTTAGSETDRKMLVLTSEKARADVVSFLAYMSANWLYVPEPDYYLAGSINEWDFTDTTYKLTKVEAGSYKYENLRLDEGAAIKVFSSEDPVKYYGNASTYTDCGYTVGENGNVVVSAGGFYTVNFFVEGQNDNHITLAKTGELPASEYYLVGSFNEWNQADTTYHLTAGSEGVFTYEGLVVETEVNFKVLEVSGDVKHLITNASTWTDCGFTLGENNNIVLTGAGKYNITFDLNGLNNNFITVEKQAEVTYVVAVYSQYVSSERAAAIKTAFEAYITTNNIDIDHVVFVELGESDSNIAAIAGLITTYNTENPTAQIDAMIGAKADKSSAFANAGYSRLGSAEYTYGTKSGSENDRRLWCKTGTSDSVGAQALLAYMNANWAQQAA